MAEELPKLAHLTLPQYQQDPYPLYRRFWEVDPVYRDEWAWVLTRHRDVVAALRDPRLSARRIGHEDDLGAGELNPVIGPLFRLTRLQVLFQDPPDHTRLRALLSRAFTPRMVEEMRRRIERLVGEILDDIGESTTFDLIADLAYPLPVTVIAEMMGLPATDRSLLKKWSDDFAEFLGAGGLSWEQIAHLAQSIGEVVPYFRRLLAERKRQPESDLLTALLEAHEAQDMLTEDEVLANCLLLLVAGHETTTNLIGNGMLVLLRHPESMDLFRKQPDLAPAAVEEFLRYESPVQMTSRVAVEPIEIEGRAIQRGEEVMLLLAAANRDPDAFADPDRLDLTRRENRHVAFGHGIHFCLGAALARLEGQIALRALVERFPRLKLTSEEIRWRENMTLRGLEALPVQT